MHIPGPRKPGTDRDPGRRIGGRPPRRDYTWCVPTERLMLLDGNGLIYRGYFALPPLTTSKGELVNAVFGFCSIVLRGIQDLHPDYVAVAFDLQGPTFRHEQYAEYKATRQRMPDDLRDQFPKVREVVKALRIPVYELAGYEADDVIGTITVDAERRGLDTTIVTGDLDMLQLVTDHTRLMTTRSGVENTILYDPAKIDDRFELVAGQMIDYKALKGDPTDNIPGVPGVGEKTAAKLIREFGTLEALYERIDEVKPDKLRDKLVEHREQVFMGKDLSTIVRDLPVEFDLEAARLGDYDRETVIRLFREYEFRTLIERLPAMTGETAGDAAEVLRGVATDGSVPAARVAGSARPSGWGTARPARPASDARRAAAVARLRRRGAPGAVRRGPGRRRRRRGRERRGAGDRGRARRPADRPGGGHRRPVTDRGPRRRPDRVARTVAGRPSRRSGSGSCSTTRARVGDRRSPSRSRARTAARWRSKGPDDAATLRRILERLATPVVGHEIKPLLVLRIGDDPDAAPTPVAFDTQVAAYVLNAALRSQTIADVVAEQLDLILPPVAELDSAARVGLEALAAIAVREPLERRLVDEGLDRLYGELELPLISVLARMEATGVALDLDALRVLAAEFGTEISRLETEIYADVGHQFNLGSPKQLEQILFFELNLPEGQADEDRLLHRRLRPGGPAARAPDDRQAARVAHLHQAPLDLRRRPADADGRRRPPPHDLPPGGRRDRPAVVVGSEPPEHPDPDAARAADPACVRGRRPGPDAGRRRLQPDRAAHPRPRVGRRAPARRVRARRRPPPRDRRARPPQGSGRGDPRRAVDGQDGQLRDRLRPERLRAVRAGQHPARRGAGIHQHLLRDLLRDQLLHARDQGAGPDPGLRDDAPRAQAPDPRAGRPQPDAARGGRTDGHQHADPGDGRGHRQDRDDPAPGATAARAGSARGRSSRSTTSCCSRSRATRSSASSRSCARRWRAPCRWTSR